MSGRRTAARIFLGVAIATLVVSVIGFVVTLILNLFVFDEFDAYGEVPIPGQRTLHLSAGEVAISFHTVVIGQTGSGLPVPDLGLSIFAPDGVEQDDIVVTEDYGSTTTVNNDSRIRVWVATIPADGDYRIQAEGNVNGYVSPSLAFGHGSTYWWLVWTFVALLVFSIVDVIIASVWVSRVRRRPVPLPPSMYGSIYPGASEYPPPVAAPSSYPPSSYTPTDDGIRIEQLRTIAALRDSGALTEDEFQSEKRRLLDGR